MKHSRKLITRFLSALSQEGEDRSVLFYVYPAELNSSYHYTELEWSARTSLRRIAPSSRNRGTLWTSLQSGIELLCE